MLLSYTRMVAVEWYVWFAGKMVALAVVLLRWMEMVRLERKYVATPLRLVGRSFIGHGRRICAHPKSVIRKGG
jgi:hypothetical protein